MPILESEPLILRPCGVRDARRIHALADDPRVLFFRLDEPARIEECEARR